MRTPHVCPLLSLFCFLTTAASTARIVADANVVPELCSLTLWVSRSSSFPASALPYVAEQRLALLFKQTIKTKGEANLISSLRVLIW